jgi:glycosyltransferase involved in cell wall biosynthesis
MRIVHVTHRAWPVIGGSERYVQEVARRQTAEGHRVTIVTTDAQDLAALWDSRQRQVVAEAPTTHQGVAIRRLPVRHFPLGAATFPVLRRAAWLLSNLSGRAATALAQFSPQVPGLPHVLAEEMGDLLFAWNLTLEGLTAAVAQESARREVPWIAIPLLHLGRKRFYTMSYQLDFLRSARTVLAQTETERAFLLEHRFPRGQVQIISPGVDPAEARAADGRRFRQKYGIEGQIVLAMGTPSYDKGIHHLVAAMKPLWREGRRTTLVLLGTQPVGEGEAHCRYLGQVPEAEKWDAVDAASVVAMPSRTESFGIVFLEAWACGKPVIGARAGAVVDVIDEGQDGLLVEFGDVKELVAALRTLLDDRDLAAQLGARGREKVLARYTWERQYARLRAVMEDVSRRVASQ